MALVMVNYNKTKTNQKKKVYI